MADDTLVPDSYAPRYLGLTIGSQLLFDITPTGLPLYTPTYDPPIPVGDLVKQDARCRLIAINIGQEFDGVWGRRPDADFIKRIIDGYRHLNQFDRWCIKIWEE